MANQRDKVKPDPLPIFWRGEFVGEMVDPKGDNFFLYGKWKPAQSEPGVEFLEVVHRKIADEEDVEVTVGKPSFVAFISVEPDDEIEVKTYPPLNSS